MTMKQTMLAFAAAAVVATGALTATASTAEAGHKHFKVYKPFKHHNFYHKRVYFPRHYGCFWKKTKVWTYHGPVWVSKKVCY